MGAVYVLLPLSRRQTAFRRFYRPERVPTKHLPPYPATNIIMYTSIGSVANGPTFDPKHLQLYRSRAVCLVWRFGLRMVFNRLDTYTQQNEDI